MAKDHKNKKPSKNVFKVAGSRSFKAKNKAKAVSTQLKKLNEGNKKKLAEVDLQLDSLQEEVRQQSSKSTDNKNKEPTKLVSNEAVEQYKENEKKSAEALEKLLDMSMS